MGKFWQTRAKTTEGLTSMTEHSHYATAIHHEEASIEPSIALGTEIISIDGLDPHLVALCTPTAFETEPYRLLGHMVEQINHAGALGIVAVSSPTPGDGKTITAINLASVLSQTQETRVLLIDADLRCPSVDAYLGLDCSSGRGLVEALRNPSLSIKNMVTRLSQFNLDVLPAGCSLDSPYEVLALPHLRVLLESMRRDYDYVIIDTPPLALFADCQYISKWVDGFLVVVAAHETPRSLLEEALHVIDPEKIIGLAFNKDEFQASQYYRYRDYYLPPSRQQRRRRHAVPMQHETSAKKKSESRSRTRFIGLGMIVVILLVLGIALWTPSPPISAATQGLIQGLQDTWQKVQEVFLSSDRHQSAPPTP